MKMKTSIALIAASALMAGVAGAQDKAAAPVAEQSKQEKETTVSNEQMKKDLGYFLGVQNGRQLREGVPTLTMDDIDVEAYMQGIKEGLVNNPTKTANDVKASLEAFQNGIDERIIAMAAANLDACKKFLAENAKKDGVVTTASGLQYKVINKGGEEKYDEKKFKNPLFKLKYEGRLIDGSVFDSSRGESVEFPLQLIPGFTEALKTMPVGAKWTIYVPAELAYGENGSAPAIEPNSALIFDIELEGISEAPEQQGGMPMQLTPEQLEQLQKQLQGAQ